MLDFRTESAADFYETFAYFTERNCIIVATSYDLLFLTLDSLQNPLTLTFELQNRQNSYSS